MVIISNFVILIFVLFVFFMVAGGAYVIVDFFFENWLYFAIGSGILLLIRSIIILVKGSEKWPAFVYFVLEIIRIPLTYLTLVWFSYDWVMEAKNNLLGFVIKTGVEGIFVLVFIGIAIVSPWSFLSDDGDGLTSDFSWIFPIISIVLILIPLGVRMIVEKINTGTFLPVELFAKMFF